MVTPVTLPPGRLRLATSPSATGSALREDDRNRRGRGLAARPACACDGAMTVTLRRTRSAAALEIDHFDPRPSGIRSATLRLRHSRFRSGPGGTRANGPRTLRRFAAEESDHRHRRLLRPRRQRPRRRRAAEEGEEGAALSFDYLVGSSSVRRDCEVERLRGLEIKHQLELCRLHHRQVGGLPLENTASIDAGLAKASVCWCRN